MGVGAFNRPKMLPVGRQHAPRLPNGVKYTVEYNSSKAASSGDGNFWVQNEGNKMVVPTEDSSAIALKLVKTCEKHEAAQARYKGLFEALQSLQPLLQELADNVEVGCMPLQCSRLSKLGRNALTVLALRSAGHHSLSTLH
jgi:hypothetical protein